MIKNVNKSKKEAADKILNGDFSKMAFFLKIEEIDLPKDGQESLVTLRAKKFLKITTV